MSRIHSPLNAAEEIRDLVCPNVSIEQVERSLPPKSGDLIAQPLPRLLLGAERFSRQAEHACRAQTLLRFIRREDARFSFPQRLGVNVEFARERFLADAERDRQLIESLRTDSFADCLDLLERREGRNRGNACWHWARSHEL